MKNTIFYKKWLRFIIGAFFILMLLIFALQEYAVYKIDSIISEKLPAQIELNYNSMALNLFVNTINIKDVKFKVLPDNKLGKEINIGASKINIKGLDYWALWKKECVIVRKISVYNTDIEQKDNATNLIDLAIKNAFFELKKFKTSADIAKQKIPFNYSNASLNLDSLTYNLTDFEILTIKALSYRNQNLKTGAISVKTKYDVSELSNKIDKERDHVQLQIKNSIAKNLTLSVLNDSLKIEAEQFKFNQSNLKLYRDKTLPDDVHTKLLYSAMLRKLPIKLQIDTLLLNGQNISYTEKVLNEIQPTPILFKRWSARIDNLSNINQEKTHVKCTALFIDDAPIELNFNFNTANRNDSFEASIIIKNLKIKAINPFLESNAQVRANGVFQELYLTVSGNYIKSSGDMKMKYEDFQFQILDENRLGVKKLVTTIANLFTNDGSKTDANGYRYGEINVERDKTKSFFNYLWLNTKDGLKNTVTGNGKKRK
ncbi:hypothetical protein GCM10022291_07890 [Postechiella marina]|uniref:DUF748 domain-containing protein n=1 Tax=Postechiella marina TaxID=943941 RepID=A0ABP8C327_9FLAO